MLAIAVSSGCESRSGANMDADSGKRFEEADSIHYGYQLEATGRLTRRIEKCPLLLTHGGRPRAQTRSSNAHGLIT